MGCGLLRPYGGSRTAAHFEGGDGDREVVWLTHFSVGGWKSRDACRGRKLGPLVKSKCWQVFQDKKKHNGGDNNTEMLCANPCFKSS